MPLRDYQQTAFEAVTSSLSKSIEPIVVEAATGAGKSHIIAAVADWVSSKAIGKVLCLAPSKELTEQNHSKFLATGNPASFYSASIDKSLAHDVVFGTPLSVLNSIQKFPKVSAVVIDECHGITPTIKKIVDELEKKNPNLRIVGLSATPYRMNSGYVYRYDENGDPVAEDETIEPYFHQLVCRVTAHELIEMGYLTPPVTETDHVAGYDTSGLEKAATGLFKADTVEQAFEGKGRLTSHIVADIVSHSQDRQGVIIFAATIRHAEEVLESLPPHNSAIVTGGTGKKEREQILKRFKARKIKYLVNVAVLTTGFDAEHIDVVALLRRTESVGLMQQMIGRGLRLCEGKTDCLILDYAENISTHCPDGDVFNPTIKTVRKSDAEQIEVICPVCSSKNTFAARKNDGGYKVSADGYFTDLADNPISREDGIPIPAHYGRRCYGFSLVGGVAERCEYRWSFRECPDCQHENDIAARACEVCNAEIIDPNEKLRMEFARIKADPYEVSTDEVLHWSYFKHYSAAGNETLKINYTTQFNTFSIWYMPLKQREWKSLCMAVFGKIAPDVDSFISAAPNGKRPLTITVKKDKKSKFYKVYSHNEPADRAP